MAELNPKTAKKAKSRVSETPLMKQYAEIKSKYPDAVLLFRVGDFYETFGEDAVRAASALGITLTKRHNGAASEIELAGFPHHALDSYLPKLVRAGYRVAICDQLEDPKLTKKIVKRGITELVTPGVSYNDKTLDTKSNNFLAAVHLQEGKKEDNTPAGVAFLDVSTGEFYVGQGTKEYIEKLIHSFQPSEILFQKKQKGAINELFGDKFYSYGLDEWIFTDEYSHETLLKHFGTASLKGFGIDGMNACVIAAGAALHYLSATQHDKVKHIQSLSRIEEDHFVWLDKFSIKNLEIFHRNGDASTPLIDLMDQTISPMGSRMMRRWIGMPLKEKAPIVERHEAVELFLKHSEFAEQLRKWVQVVGDLERLISKVATGRINPRELVHLQRGLKAIEEVKKLCESSEISSEAGNALQKIADQLNPCTLIREKIAREMAPDPPPALQKGKVIADGVNAQLDELRTLRASGKEFLVEIQKRESERTSISSLKVGFNNVFGYYLEVTHKHQDKVPEDWIRKQTLTNCERYITEELKQYEEKILGAEAKIAELEQQLFNNLIASASDYIPPIQLNANLIARLDCLLSFAKMAKQFNYVRPKINDSTTLDIKNGRHPVIEQMLEPGNEYVANDVLLDGNKQQIIIITGPNMSGKSALLRQTALIVIMAQAGSFVPASEANIGLVDKIFTRVGASDNLSQGESTFMVEMNETASILNNLSERSLVLLDEIGRGTSTFDGISIAWALAEFLHQHPGKPKTLFATHYHELNELENQFDRIHNYNVSVKEAGGKVIFMRKLIKGGSEHSFGIHVAKMAGVPATVVNRANEILTKLEVRSQESRGKNQQAIKEDDPDMQLSFFKLDDPVLEQIRDEINKTDIDNLTPIEALNKLNEIKKLTGGK